MSFPHRPESGSISNWIPAYAGMTTQHVIPASAGIPLHQQLDPGMRRDDNSIGGSR
jgi:hypothetical protein